MDVFIYTLLDPRTGEVRYVGKTIDIETRLALHLSEKKESHKNRWLAQLKLVGLVPFTQVIEIIYDSDDVDWQERERFWIRHYRKISPLTNLDAGGRSGQLKSPETKAKMSAAQKGRKMTPESIAKMKATKAERWTPERRAKMGAHHIGKKHSEETKSKMSAARKGKPCSPEKAEKIRQAKIGKWNGGPMKHGRFSKLNPLGRSFPLVAARALN